MNKVRKLRNELCNPEPVRRFVRLLTIPGIPIVSVAIMLFFGRMLVHRPFALAIYVFAAVFATFIILILTFLSIKRVIRFGTLKNQGRMSWQYLVNNQIEQQAAEEYFGEERVECKLSGKGDNVNEFSYRKNVVTPSFVFIMSDGVVLHHSEIAGTQRQRISFQNTDSHQVLSRYEILSLRMADDTLIPLMSVTCDETINNSDDKNDLRHIPAEELEKMKAILSMLKAGNPACATSLDLAHSTVRSV